jgi:acyl-ACP thioesterase
VPEFLPLPPSGRRFTAGRKVRLSDADAKGSLKLDAISRYLQDVANDDAVDSGIEGALYWVLRKVAVHIIDSPRFGDFIELTTFCSGYGNRFAERRTSITIDGRQAVEAVALWVSVNPENGRPAVLGEQFHAIYGEAAGGRTVNARLHHPLPAHDATRRQWQQRVTDHDLLGHANNSIAMAAVEDLLAGRQRTLVEMEYRDAIDPADDVELVTAGEWMWLMADGRVRVSARLECIDSG